MTSDDSTQTDHSAYFDKQNAFQEMFNSIDATTSEYPIIVKKD